MRSFRFWPDKGITAEKRLIDANGHKIPILILKRKDHTGNAPGILWFHGGGYATGIKEMVYIGRAESLVNKIWRSRYLRRIQAFHISPVPCRF